MSRIFPHPLLLIALLLMWLLLQQSVAPGHVLMGFLVAWGATHAMALLQPHKPRIRRLDLILKLLVEVAVDITRSNIAVSALILTGGHAASRFIKMPLELKDPVALAVLSGIVTATPGSAWLEYSPAESTVLLHVFDVIDEAQWVDTIKQRYETLLLEIFQ